MLTVDERDRIKAEEMFRHEVRSGLQSPKSRWSAVWEVLSTPFVLWFLSTVVIGLATWQYTQWTEDRARERERVARVERLDREIAFRLNRLQQRRDRDFFADFISESQRGDPAEIKGRLTQITARATASYLAQAAKRRAAGRPAGELDETLIATSRPPPPPPPSTEPEDEKIKALANSENAAETATAGGTVATARRLREFVVAATKGDVTGTLVQYALDPNALPPELKEILNAEKDRDAVEGLAGRGEGPFPEYAGTTLEMLLWDLRANVPEEERPAIQSSIEGLDRLDEAAEAGRLKEFDLAAHFGRWHLRAATRPGAGSAGR